MSRFTWAAATLLAVPAAAIAEEVPICTDRPAKANAVCTVPVGKWQIESSIADWWRLDADGAGVKVLTLGSLVVKFGLSAGSDLEVGFTPYIHAETKVGEEISSSSGIGDLTVRYKQRLTADNATVQVGLIPFVKLPTAADDIGNGKVEGGLAAPISIATGSPVTVVLGPELDLLADTDGNGRHAALVNLVNVSGTVAPGLTLAGELWTMTNFDPADTVTLASADAALAYLVSDNAQLDVGANFGLNRHAAGVELYAGLSFRF